MPISLEEVRHVARLARLELDDRELMTFQGELNALLAHFEDIRGVDVTGFMAKPHAVAQFNVWRSDAYRSSLTRDQALANAPVSKGGLFIVPTIIEE